MLIDATTRVIVQGITGRQASWSVADMLSYGTRIVAGVVPGRGGSSHSGLPVFNTVAEAATATGANASIVYVPAASAGEAVAEAIEARVPIVVYPGDLLPLHDTVRLRRAAIDAGVVFIGPNTPGLISPEQAKLGFMPSFCYRRGRLGVISRSGSLSYEICWRLSSAGIGQSCVVGVGGDVVKGMTIGEVLELFSEDPETDAILVLGEVGGVEEYQAADYRGRTGAKPVVAFLVGQAAPHGRKLGHAGALIASTREGYAAKVAVLQNSDILVATSISGVVPLVREALRTQ